MNLINRYVLAGYFRVFALALAAFSGVYLLVEFFEKMDDFLEHEARFIDFIIYFSAKVPLIVTQVSPLAVLLAAFMALGGLSRTNELTAMRAGGISLWRISAPLLAMGLATALVVLALSEFIVPIAAKKTTHTLEVTVKGRPEPLLKRDRLWFREGEKIVNIALAVPEEQTLKGVRVFRFDRQFRLLERYDAPKADFREGRWDAPTAVVHRFDPLTRDAVAMERLHDVPLPLEKRPADFRSTQARNDELTFRDLRRLARRMQAEGYDAVRYRVDLQNRIATPFASVIMAFLGIPFALKKGRGSSLATGIAIAVGIGVSYHLAQAMLLAFGYSSVLPPVIAAWAGHFLFLLLGIWMVLTVRE